MTGYALNEIETAPNADTDARKNNVIRLTAIPLLCIAASLFVNSVFSHKTLFAAEAYFLRQSLVPP
jgi:hypothetical protein